MKKNTMHAVVGILAAFVAMQVRANYYVAQNGQIPGEPYDGWSNAASNIQDVLTYVGAVEVTIHVGAGHYGPPPNAVDWNGLNVVYHSQPLTLLSSNNVPESVLIDGGGTHRGIGLLQGGFIAGITVTNGYSTSTTHGGGIRVEQTGHHLVVSNSVVVGNYSGGRGGGIYAHNSRTDIIDSRVTHNHATTDGGGIGTGYPGRTFVQNSVFAHNEAGGGGGGLHHISGHSSLIVEDSIIAYNVAAGSGGGIDKRFTSDGVSGLMLRNSIVRGNVAKSHDRDNGGNAIYLRRVIAEIVNCLIVENYNEALSEYANAIYYNVDTGNNGCLNLRLFNCTLAFNGNPLKTADLDRLVRFRRDPSATPILPNEFHIYNSILYHNSPAMEVIETNTDVDFSHNCTDIDLSAFPGGNHVTDPPEFANAGQGDYRLSGGSPCIDAGNNAYVQTAVDLDGKQRIDRIVGKVDIGAFEYRRPGTLILVH